MINKIFWDLDETLLHTFFNEPNDLPSFGFELDHDWYYTVIRPRAQEILQFSRELVGAENVLALTASTRDYAETVNEKGALGFLPDQIYPREFIQNWYYNDPDAKKLLQNPNNVLIDNLRTRENVRKMDITGISEENYFWVTPEFSGDENDPEFVEKVKAWLTEKHSV